MVDWGHLGVMVQGLDVGGEVGLVKASVGVSFGVAEPLAFQAVVILEIRNCALVVVSSDKVLFLFRGDLFAPIKQFEHKFYYSKS